MTKSNNYRISCGIWRPYVACCSIYWVWKSEPHWNIGPNNKFNFMGHWLIYSTRARLPVSILASSGMIMISGGLMLTAVSFAFGEYRNLDLMQISLQSLIAQIYLIVIITIVGFTDFYWLLRVTSASLANTFAYVSPVIAVLLGWAILHENLTITTIIAMVIILLGVALMVTKKKVPKKPTKMTSKHNYRTDVF